MRFHKWLIGLSLLLASTAIGAQQTETGGIDSLLQLIEIRKDTAASVLGDWYHQLGNHYDAEGELLKAIEATELALEIRLAHEAEAADPVLVSAYNLGAYYAEAGDFPNALARLQLIVDRGPNRKLGLAYYKMGFVYGELGEYDLADRAYQAALERAPWSEQAASRAILFQEWGSAYLQQDDSLTAVKAIQILSRALPFYQEDEELSEASAYRYLYLLNRLGLAHLYTRQYLRAEQLFQSALDFNKNCCADEEIDELLYSNLGLLYRRSGKTALAIEYHRRSLAINQSLSEGLPDPYLARNFNNLSGVWLAAGQLDSAHHYAKLALRYLRPESPTSSSDELIAEIPLDSFATNNPIELHTYFWDLAKISYRIEVSREQPNWERILRLFQRGDQLVDRLRRQQRENGSKLSWRRQALAFYADAVRASRAANAVSQLFHFSEKSRAILLLDERRQRQLESRLSAEQRTKIGRMRRELSVLRQADGSAAEYLNLSSALLELLNDWQITDPEETTYALNADVLADLRQSLGDRETFVEYFLHDSVCLVIAVDAESVKVVDLPPLSTIRQQLKAYRKSLTSPHESFSPIAAHWLYAQLLAPLMIPKGNTVTIVGDDQLLSAPWSALLTEEVTDPELPYRDWPWLFKQYHLSREWSAYIRLLNASKSVATTNDQLLYLAPMSEPNSSFVHEQLLLPLSKMPERLFQGDWRPISIIGPAANRTYFEEEAGRFALIHLATHAYLGSGDSSPYFLLSDGPVFTSEIPARFFQAQHITLSACQTGLGSWQAGEGLASIGRSFARTGIESSTTSLWPVDEAATVKLLAGWYQALSEKNPRASAMSIARQRYLDDQTNNQLAHPYRWAGIVYQGPNRPLDLLNSTSWYARWWYALIPLLLVITVLLWSTRKK